MGLPGLNRYQRLLKYARSYWGGWTLIAVATFLSSLVAVVQPWPVKVAVDNVLNRAPLSAEMTRFLAGFPVINTPIGLLTSVAIASVVVFVVGAANNTLLTWTWTRVGRRMVYNLAADLFAVAQRRSVVFHTTHPVGDLLSRINVDSWCVYRAVDLLIFSPAQAILTCAFMLVLMFKMDVKLTWIALSVAPLMAASALLLGRPLRAVARRRREIEGRIQSHVHQTLTGMSAVQAFQQHDREQERFEQQAAEAIRAHGRGVFIKSAGEFASGLLPTLGTAATLWFGVHAVQAARVSVGELLIFVAYLRSLQASAVKLAENYASLQETRASADRVFELLEMPPEVPELPAATALGCVRGEITFDNVTFGYEPDRQALRGITLHVNAGEVLGIVGGTGAGKSTLAGLVPRLFDPWAGRVLIDGHDARNVTLESLRDRIALVQQESVLFPDTIAANIAFARPEATQPEIEHAARAANAHEFILNLPEGYQTRIGERGATLAGGERQRLCIARAILRDAPILILDEPTSALDLTNEASIMDALGHLRKGRTTLMIAHRLSTVRDADRIIVLDHGRIAEDGTHEQLLHHAGIYAALYQSQCGQAIRQTAGSHR